MFFSETTGRAFVKTITVCLPTFRILAISNSLSRTSRRRCARVQPAETIRVRSNMATRNGRIDFPIINPLGRQSISLSLSSSLFFSQADKSMSDSNLVVVKIKKDQKIITVLSYSRSPLSYLSQRITLRYNEITWL